MSRETLGEKKSLLVISYRLFFLSLYMVDESDT